MRGRRGLGLRASLRGWGHGPVRIVSRPVSFATLGRHASAPDIGSGPSVLIIEDIAMIVSLTRTVVGKALSVIRLSFAKKFIAAVLHSIASM